MTTKTDIQKTPAKQPQKAAGNSVFRLPGSTGKELDLETGFSYFGARYLDNALSTAWLSVDPMSDKYPSISPYAYCSWNPVKLVDLDGREVYVSGDEADRIVEQLQTGNMEVSRTEDGRLSVNLHEKNRDDLSQEEKQIFDAITSKDVTIHVEASKSAIIDGKHIFIVRKNGEEIKYECYKGGSNIGSIFNATNNKADSYCFIDIDWMKSNGCDQGVAHEVSECYQAGLLAINNQKDIDPAIRGVENTLMKQAHNSAVPERLREGGIYKFGINYGCLGKIKPINFFKRLQTS